jgi:hypothetical protein
MLKTVSSITNAIGALNYKGTWDANANSPALTSSVGTKGDYYVVGTAGSTNLNGISNWGIGDWAAFNGSVWQRVEGGANLNGVDLSVSGTSTLSGLTASTALALNASKEIVSVTNTGTGNNVLASSPSIATPTLTGDVQMSTGNLVVGTSGKGIDFSATAGTGTSELLADYEEGTWTPVLAFGGASVGITYAARGGTYTKIGRLVTGRFVIVLSSKGSSTGAATIEGLPFTVGADLGSAITEICSNFVVGPPTQGYCSNTGTNIVPWAISATGVTNPTDTNFANNTRLDMWFQYNV